MALSSLTKNRQVAFSKYGVDAVKKRYLKAALAGVALISGTYLGLMVYAMAEMPMSDLVRCSAGARGIRIPGGLCDYYMKHYRGDEEDMQELAIGGLDPILNIESSKKYDIAAFLIAKGLNINGVNHYSPTPQSRDITPLHASVLYNDVERAKFLIDKGADLNIKSKTAYNTTPLELAKELQAKKPGEDRSEIVRLLSESARRPSRAFVDPSVPQSN